MPDIARQMQASADMQARLLAALDALEVLRERRDWLTARIAAKESVGWDIAWDVRERNALVWAVQQLEALPVAA